VMGPEALWPAMCAWMVLTSPCCTLGWGASGLSFFVDIFKGCVYKVYYFLLCWHLLFYYF
jgi:hypothetical protein